jgi:uncharacterized protein (TIGR03083 family)
MEPTVDDLVEFLHEASDMLVTLLEDRVDVSVMIEPDGWSVRQAIVHLIAGTRMYAGCLRREPSPLGDFRRHTLEAFNGGAWMALAERDSQALGCLLEAGVSEMAASVPHSELDRGGIWHTGISMPTPFFLRTMLSEFLLHGFDIASALGRAWSPSDRIAGPASALFADVAAFVFRGEEDDHHSGRYWFDAPPHPGWGFTIAYSELTPIAADESVDCRVTGRPFHLMLWQSGRVNWEDSELHASGRNQSAAVSLMGCFHSL